MSIQILRFHNNCRLFSQSAEFFTDHSYVRTDIDQMGDGGDRLLLHDGGGTEQRARRHKKNITESAVAHFVEDITA